MRIFCESDKGLGLLERETRFLGELSQKPDGGPPGLPSPGSLADCPGRVPGHPPLAGLAITQGDSWIALDFLGRRFLLFCLRAGDQRAVEDAFSQMRVKPPARVNLVPLHVEGELLGGFLRKVLLEPGRASLWIPWGVWERLAADLKGVPRNPPVHVGAYLSDQKGSGGLNVIGFDFDNEVGVADEGSADKGAGFFEGVSLHFALIPHLERGAAVQVSFLANDQQLTVAPDRSFGLLDFIHGEGRARKVAEALQDQYARWLIANPELRDAVQKRSRQLLLWRQQRPVLGWTTNGQWGIRLGAKLAAGAGLCETVLPLASRIWNPEAHFVAAGGGSSPETRSVEDSGSSEVPVPAVMLLCGIPETMTRIRSDLLGPLSSPRAWPQSDASAAYQPTVLAEHLVQIEEVFPGGVEIFLFTTPVLDTYIRAHLEDDLRFSRMAGGCWEKSRAGGALRVTLARQPIHVNIRSPHADGGYKLHFGDHFDALGVLRKHWLHGLLSGVIILSHNHSPFRWSGIRSAFERWYETGDAAAVTVYETVNEDLTESERKRRSYLARAGDRPVLRFAAQVSHLPSKAYSSSNVWFIRGPVLDRPDLKGHLIHEPFHAIGYEGRPPRLDDLPDVVPVRPLVSPGEFPIYVPEMRKTAAGAAAGSNAEPLRGTFLIEPAIKRNVWGGPKIADAKKWEPETIGETWEISSHPDGPATVRVDTRLLPLSEVAGCENLDYMGKFLDCQEALSIQLHPPQKAIDRIGELRSAGCREGDSAKEESFYVIKPALSHVMTREGVPQQRTHLVLGFDRAIVDGMVDTLRPWMVSNAPKRFEIGTGAMREMAGEVLRIVTERFLKNSPLKDQEGPRPSDTFCRALAFYQDEHELKGTPHGKELLFLGCGLVEFLRWLKVEAKDRETIIKEYERHKLLTNFGRSNFLCMFYSTWVEDDRWYRVPAGTVHSWQGGGNWIVELSNRSDSTLRLVDFGREFSGGSERPMHYEAALFSLTEHSFVGDGTLDQYVVDMRKATAEGVVCHKDLKVRHRPTGAGVWKSMNEEEPVFYMNLGGPVRVDAVPDGKSLTLPDFSTLVTTPGIQVDFQRSGRGDDNVLEISKRTPESRRTVAVTSHRHAQAEYGCYEEGVGLRFSGSPFQIDTAEEVHVVPGHRSSGRRFVWARDLTAEKVKALRRLASKKRVNILADVEAAALGEAFHPLGGLPLKEPGMILHQGDGFCAGFWDPERQVQDLSLWSAVGRWLAFDVHTGKFWLGDLGPIEEAGHEFDEIKALAGDNLPGKLDSFLKRPPKHKPPRVPLSWWLSSDAVLLRGQSLLGGSQGAPVDWMQRYPDFHRRPPNNVPQAFSEVLRHADAEDATRLIREVGNEIGTVARIVDCVAHCVLKSRDLAAKSYLENVVLTGWPAANFGWILDQESGLYKDVLIETANEALMGDLGEKGKVKRSRIIHPIIRETAGAVACLHPELRGLL